MASTSALEFQGGPCAPSPKASTRPRVRPTPLATELQGLDRQLSCFAGLPAWNRKGRRQHRLPKAESRRYVTSDPHVHATAPVPSRRGPIHMTVLLQALEFRRLGVDLTETGSTPRRRGARAALELQSPGQGPSTTNNNRCPDGGVGLKLSHQVAAGPTR